MKWIAIIIIMLINLAVADFKPIESPTDSEILQFARGFIAGDPNIDSAKVTKNDWLLHAEYILRENDVRTFDTIRLKIDELLKALSKTADMYPGRIKSVEAVVYEPNGTLKGCGTLGVDIKSFYITTNKSELTSSRKTQPALV